MNYTDEQQKIFETIDKKKHKNVLINSVAGSGKTTAMVGLVEHILMKHPNARILYLVFNKSMQQEAERKFSKMMNNVTVKTAHSFAYQIWARVHGGFEASNKFRMDILSNNLYKNYKLPANIRYTKHCYMDALHNDCTLQWSKLEVFCNNLATAIDQNSREITYDLPNGKKRTTYGYEYKKGIILQPKHVDVFKKIYEDHEKSSIFTHNMYLKEVASLNNLPHLNYNYLIFDEAQDANMFMLKIVINLPVEQRWFVGDSKQAIYQFMKCVNAFEEVDGPVYELTKSFRFGQEIADIQDVVNNICITGTEQKPKTVDNKKKTVLFRTNSGMLDYAIKLVKEHEDGAIKLKYVNSSFDTIEECGLKDSQRNALFFFYKSLKDDGQYEKAEWLDDTFKINYYKDNYGCMKRSNNDVVPECFKDVLAFQSECAKEGDEFTFREIIQMIRVEDADVLKLAKMYDEYQEDICPIMAKLIQAENGETGDRTEYFLCTAHKSKGLEWDDVEIAGDFTLTESSETDTGTLKRTKNFNDEMNLIYVAMTRGRYRLNATALGPELRNAGIDVDDSQLLIDVSENPLDRELILSRPLVSEREPVKALV